MNTRTGRSLSCNPLLKSGCDSLQVDLSSGKGKSLLIGQLELVCSLMHFELSTCNILPVIILCDPVSLLDESSILLTLVFSLFPS